MKNIAVLLFLAAIMLAVPAVDAPVFAEEEAGSSTESGDGGQSEEDTAAAENAAASSALNDQLRGVQNDLQNARSEYDAAVAELKQLQSQISGLNTEIKDTEAKIAAVQTEIDAYNQQIETLSAQIAELETEVSDQNSDLNQRLRVMYETGDQSMFVVLLGSENIVDFLANIEMIQRIHESDKKLLAELQEKLEQIEKKKKDMEAIQVLLVSEKGEMETHKAELDSKKAELKTAEARVQALKDAAIEDIDRLEAESNRIQQELAARESTWEYGGGKMSIPAAGPITSEFGMRVNPVTGVYKLHAGLDIGASYGAQIHAAADGVVIFAGWNSGGYGNLVMIDHGSNIVTCYGHNSSIAVSAGQSVSRGQVIAFCGSTGNSTGPHCHWEVRVSGVPQNPRGWL